MVKHASVVIPTCAYSMIFLFGSILITVEIPQLFQEKFDFNSQQLGLQFIGIIIGSIIGEQLGGVLSDRWMKMRAKKIHGSPEPEYRLWLSYIGFALTICGLVVFLVRTDQAGTHWNITPIVGAAIAAGGNQIVTTVLITYAVDCRRDEAASIGVFVTFVRQIWGFIGPFWYVQLFTLDLVNAASQLTTSRFPSMFANVGLPGSAGIGVALIVAVSIVPTVILHFKGRVWRVKNVEE